MLTTREWVGLLCLFREREPRSSSLREEVDYPWWVMAGLALWAASHRVPLRWTARYLLEEGRPKPFRILMPRRLRRKKPDASTLSRRWRSEKLLRLLAQVEEALARPTSFGAIDGLILPVGRHSLDLFARFGGPGSGFQKGYKAVRLVNHHGQALRTVLASANVHEATLAKELLEGLRGKGFKMRRVAGDAAYDSEGLREEFAHVLGATLLAPVVRRGRGYHSHQSCCTRRGAHRRKAQRLLQTPWGKHWMKERGTVERSNGWLRQWPHELGRLPSFIRGPIRTMRWILSHEVLCSYRKLLKWTQKAM